MVCLVSNHLGMSIQCCCEQQKLRQANRRRHRIRSTESTNERAAQWCDERMLVILVISNAHLWLKFDGRHFSFGCYRWVPLYVWRVLVTEHCGKAHISSTARWLWDRFYFPRRMTSFIAKGNFIDDVQFNEFIEFLFLFLFFSMTLAIPERCCCRWSTPIDVAYN